MRNSYVSSVFYNEAALILLHADNRQDIFIGNFIDGLSDSSQECKVNQLAENKLIPPDRAVDLIEI